MSHIERMKKEYSELNDKVKKLSVFIHTSETFKTLATEEQVRMSQQLGFMESYLRVLDTRIWVAVK